jgi:hypothetical protein
LLKSNEPENRLSIKGNSGGIEVKITGIAALAAVVLICGADGASAGIVTFDDAYAVSATPASFYSTTPGLTITGDFLNEVIGGVGNGDPGNWSLNGTNGSAFLGCNDGNDCSPTFNFNSAITNVSLDIGLSYQGTGTFTVTGYLGASVVATSVFTVIDPDSNGTWGTAILNGSIDKVVVTSSGAGAFGIDNLAFGPDAATGAPEPATFALVAGALASLGVLRRRRV